MYSEFFFLCVTLAYARQDEDGGSFPQPGGGAGLASAAGVSAVAMRTVKEKNRILELENEVCGGAPTTLHPVSHHPCGCPSSFQRLSSDLEQALRAAYMLREDLGLLSIFPSPAQNSISPIPLPIPTPQRTRSKRMWRSATNTCPSRRCCRSCLSLTASSS